MRKAFIVAALVASFSLSACGLQWPEVDQVAQAKIIGLSKQKVRACLGAPTSRKAIGSTEIWSYDSGTVRIEGSGFATSGNPRHPRCRVNIVMTNGAVSQINYSGLAGDTLDLGERCVFAAERCAGP
jgi:outer membrane protein assembly factor BamE (lipoprotein component of BamABCDE complex)